MNLFRRAIPAGEILAERECLAQRSDSRSAATGCAIVTIRTGHDGECLQGKREQTTPGMGGAGYGRCRQGQDDAFEPGSPATESRRALLSVNANLFIA